MFMTAIICSNRIGGMNWICETQIGFDLVTEENKGSSVNEVLDYFSYTYSICYLKLNAQGYVLHIHYRA